jgi:hypothetical protein
MESIVNQTNEKYLSGSSNLNEVLASLTHLCVLVHINNYSNRQQSILILK